jgi:hypothetical protein
MVNAVAVTTQQRMIALKTGFEALTGTSNSRECARRVRALFETTTAAHLDLLPWKGILWSPKERTDLQRVDTLWTGRVVHDERSELEDCLMALGKVRDTIIHDGRVPAVEYGPPPERPLSRYAGNLFWKGERLLRESVKASLGVDVLLCGALARRALWQAVAEERNLILLC